MADIRCSNCQTLNPAGSTVCKKCGRPLADETAGWLNSLRGDSGPSSFEESAPPDSTGEPAQPNEEIPDWLHRIRQRNQEESSQPSAFSSAQEPSEEIPDWLKSLQSSSPENSSVPESEDEPDWLKNLRGTQPSAGSESAAPSEPFAAKPAANEQDDQPDWMENLESWKAGGDQQPEQAAPEQPIDWTSRFGEGQPPAETPASTEENDQDWLAKLSAESGIQPAAGESEPDWFAGSLAAEGTTAGASQPEQSADDMDWLNRLGGESGTGETPQASAQNPFAMPQEPADAGQAFRWEDETASSETTPGTSSETPDWLSQFETHEPEAELPSSEIPSPFNAEPAETTGETPDWLRQFDAHESEAEQPSFGIPAPSEGEPAAGTPDWLQQFETHEPEAEQPSFGIPAPSEGEPAAGTPDWLQQFEAHVPEAEQPSFDAAMAGEPEAAEPAAELPDWLSGFSAQAEEKPVDEAKPWSGPADEAEPEPAAVPDWLQNFQPGETPQQPAEPVAPIAEESVEDSFSWQSLGISTDESISKETAPADAAPFAAANLPDWLDETHSAVPRGPYDQDLIPPAEPAGEVEGANAFAQTGLPEWLDESGATLPAAEAASEELPAEEGEGTLEAAELPGWLQSMRPIEMVAPKPTSTEEKKVEKAGPLAGLSGVLPTEDLAGQYIKPPLYSVKLRVSEKQRVHASLIESLISEETQPQAIPPERSEAPQRVLRFLVAAILIIAMLLPMLNFLPAFPAGDMLPQELIAFETTLSDESILPQGSAVLLALEYEPGLSGELQTASEAVIRRLAERNIRLTVISTSPSGPILAETLLEKAKFDPALVVNLGYLAGGSTGLQSFSASPIQAAPATLQGQLAPWNSGTLTGISKLSDYAAAIVLTDDPDKGRNWVEQVEPALNGKPMLMVTSAQAAPMLVPYFNSGQVQGIISGIAGAAGYESLTQSSGTATLLRGSYQYGMLLTALLILAGSLITGVITSISRGKAEKEA